jgi:hypothetical protein
MDDSTMKDPESFTRTWSDYGSESYSSKIIENTIILPWIATVIIILLSFSSVRLKIWRWFRRFITGPDEVDNEEINLFDVLLNKIGSIRCFLFRVQGMEAAKSPQLPDDDSKKPAKDYSKISTLKNIALTSSDHTQIKSQRTQSISYDTNLEPAFLHEEDYPEDWLTYDPLRGLISRRLLKELQEKDHLDKASI